MINDLRLRYYPRHADYRNHANEFRPFVTSFGQANYRSQSLNTDQLGFRNQCDQFGKAVNFYTLRQELPEANLLIGGSTAFGVDCSCDEATFASLITRSGIPLLNWGLRGAVCQQELITYLFHKHLLPKLHHIIIFSGANDASLVCLQGNFAYPEWGSVFSEDSFCRKHTTQYGQETRHSREIGKVISWVEKQFNRGGMRKHLLNWLGRNEPPPFNQSSNIKLTAAERLQIVIGHLSNCFETWGWIAKMTGAQVHYVLQPVAGWSTKKLSDMEHALISSDIQSIPELATLTSSAFYQTFKAALSQTISSSSIRFHDANLWLSEEKYHNENVFTDSCHLNDRGNSIIAQMLTDKILTESQ